nr:hypothetical protein [Nitrosopumilus sp.]
EEISGHPTVLWTGGGYHIYQPIKIVNRNGEKLSLESFSNFKEYLPFVRTDLTTAFIRFASNHLTNGKNDPKHNPSTKSCLVRIPKTINSKHNEKIRIVQRWDEKDADAKTIILNFLDNLIQRKIEYDAKIKETHQDHLTVSKIKWIE